MSIFASLISRLSLGHRSVGYTKDTLTKQTTIYNKKKETRMRLLVSPQGLEPWTH